MPITRKQFEIGVDDVLLEQMRDTHDFLAQRKGEAFTQEELNKLAPAPPATLVGLIQELPITMTGVRPAPSVRSPALQKLVELGAVEARGINSTLYFAYRSDLEI